MRTERARYWREGDVWEVELVDDDRVHTFASTLGRARRYIREATAAMYDLELDEVSIEDHVELPDHLASDVEVVVQRRAELEQAEVEVADQTITLVKELLEAGLSVRDAGDLVHLSAQRVSQLARQG